MTDLEQRVTDLVSLVLDVPADQIPATDASDTPQWDSLAHLSIVVAVEQEFGLRIRPEESRRLRTIPRICALVATAKGA